MFTKNGKAIFASFFITTGNDVVKGYIPAKGKGGTIYYIGGRKYQSGFPVNGQYNFTTSTSASNTGVMFGTGTNTPTEDDYKLQTPITSGVSVTAPTYNFTVDENGNPMRELTYTVTNTGSSTLTITEVGWFVNGPYYATAAGENANTRDSTSFLIDRTLLDSPLVIAAGESGLLKYTTKAVLFSAA